MTAEISALKFKAVKAHKETNDSVFKSQITVYSLLFNKSTETPGEQSWTKIKSSMLETQIVPIDDTSIVESSYEFCGP
jgi:predicted nucleic acid-binding protein